jgi:hypothetical protein
MDLEGIDIEVIVDACRMKDMNLIPMDHIQRVHSALHKRKRDPTTPNQPQGSNPARAFTLVN